MASEYVRIGKVSPVYRGIHASNKSYERLDIVSNSSKTIAYIAQREIPAGVDLTDENYWVPVLNVDDTISGVRDVANSLKENLNERTTDVERITSGHFYPIIIGNEYNMLTYKEVDGEVNESGLIKGSAQIACPKYLCLDFDNADARCYLYFYDYVDGVYVPRWDILNGTTSTGIKNYINSGSVRANMLEIPDGVWMQASISVEGAHLFGWDGEPFGPSISGDETVRVTNGTYVALHEDGSSGVTIPGVAKYVCCNDSAIFSIWGYRNGEYEPIETTHTRKFWRAPEGYEFFRARLYFGEASPYRKTTHTGDVSDFISMFVDVTTRRASARAKKVIEACELTSTLRWSLFEQMYVRNGTGYTYKPDVIYNGIPYSSQWTTTHFIGWHVSPHTFVNAVNDIDSAMYCESVDAWGTIGPYYGTVCSAYATMCDGWPYPQTNAGFVYDPDVSLSFVAEPPIGAVYSDLLDHCLIPERIDYMGNIHSVSMYEAALPVSGRRTRYSNIDKAADTSVYNAICLDGYLDGYGYVAHHVGATSMLTSAPYADFADVEIVNAGALPYKGDRCVYTSEEQRVNINVKDPAATTLIIVSPSGVETSISVSEITGYVDVKNYLTEDGIYFVRTNTNDISSSFEYHIVEPEVYTLTDGVVSFEHNDFWYAVANLRGDRLFEGAETCCIPSRISNNYSDWSNGGHYVSSVVCVFYKGVYGAYPVTATHK